MNRVILITGSRKGIGRYLAERFLEDGDIVIGCSRQATDLMHDAYFHYLLNISDELAIKKMLKDFEEVNIDVLINNAGIASMNHCLLTTKKKAIEILDTNVIGTFVMSREIGKLMVKQGYGHIINFSTLAVPMSVEGEAVYVASKAAVEALTKVMAKELPMLNINCVAPGIVDTELSKHGTVNLPKTEFSEILETVNYFLNNKISGHVFYSGRCLE